MPRDPEAEAQLYDPNAPAFRLVDPHIPFEAAIDRAVTLADPNTVRTGGLDGDGAPDGL